MNYFPKEKKQRLFFLTLLLSMMILSFLTAQSPVVLVKSLSLNGAGSGPRMRIGDLNGDGRLDILMVQATSKKPSQVQMLTAIDGYTGQRLWQVGSDNGLTGTDRDEPAQIHDIDNDGANEVVTVMNNRLLYLNGANGSVERELSLPDSNAHDCIIFANFSGGPMAQDIVLKDRYENAWALDVDGNLLWTYSGITGHYPWPYDIDNDGRDEFFIGYACLDYQGRNVYPAPITIDHPDATWIGDLDNNPSNGVEVVYGLAQNPSVQGVNTTSGRIIWTNNDNTEGQQVLMADFRPDLSGCEIYGLDRVNRSTQDSLFILSSTGQTLWKEIPDNSGFKTAIKIVRNWDGTNTPICLAFKRGDGILPELRDGRGNIINRLPMDGNICIADFGGDSKQEIIVYSTSTANIYAFSACDYNQPAPRPGHPFKQYKAYYNYSRYGSGDTRALDVEPSSTPEPYIPGDVDRNGNINILDALKVAQYYVGITPPDFYSAAADVDSNGVINIIDALKIAQLYVGLISSF